MKEMVLNDVMQSPFDLFKERLDRAEDIMKELVRPLEYYSNHNTILTLLCGHNAYPADINAEERHQLQLQKFQYVMEKIAEIKGSDTANFLNEFVAQTSGCTLYMQSAIYCKKEHMQILCNYGYDPTFVHKDKNGNDVTFEQFINFFYADSSLMDLVEFNNELCVNYNKNRLEVDLAEKPNVRQKKI